MNKYLKQFLRLGIPIAVFISILFAYLSGSIEGVIPGALIGLVIGIALSLISGFAHSESVRNLMSDWVQDIRARPLKCANFVKTIAPIFVVLFGAILTHIYAHVLLFFLLSMTASILIIFVCDYFQGEYKRALQEKETITYMANIITLILPFATIYFIFLLILSGFDFNKIRFLFEK